LKIKTRQNISIFRRDKARRPNAQKHVTGLKNIRQGKVRLKVNVDQDWIQLFEARRQNV